MKWARAIDRSEMRTPPPSSSVSVLLVGIDRRMRAV
jgi:hypothetical protein